MRWARFPCSNQNGTVGKHRQWQQSPRSLGPVVHFAGLDSDADQSRLCLASSLRLVTARGDSDIGQTDNCSTNAWPKIIPDRGNERLVDGEGRSRVDQGRER